MPKRKVDKIEQWAAQGWAPASYRHLHPDLKRFIRGLRFRPGIKECFKNCQLLAVELDGSELGRRVEYHEGIALTLGFPIEHAWLKLDGEIQDPTLSGKRPEEYVASLSYTAAAIRRNMNQTRMWCPIDAGEINRLLFSWCAERSGAPADAALDPVRVEHEGGE